MLRVILILSHYVCHNYYFYFYFVLWTIFTVRRSALHGLSHRNSVCPSVCLSVTLVHCVHMVRPTIMISSPYGSPIILVSGDITFIPKLEGVTPSEGVE